MTEMAGWFASLVFWSCAVLLLYTYGIYPLLLMVSRSSRVPGDEPAGPPSGEAPAVSVLLSVFNEETLIDARIANLLSARYPKERLEVLIGSDGSDDGTNAVLSAMRDPRVHIFLFPVRRGKASVLNDLAGEAKGTIIVFTDANTVFLPDALAELVRPFSDPSVGAVTGELVLESGLHSVGGDGEISYWYFENWMKRAESRIRSTLGATGGIYAIRAELYRRLPTEIGVMDDFLIPMSILEKGFLVKYNPLARAYEKAADSISGEFRRKIRIGASNFNGIREFRALLHPRFGFVAFALWSHKIIRWFAPFFIIGAVVASLILASGSFFFSVVVALEALFMVAAGIGAVAEHFRLRIGFLGYPYYFLAMNAALFLGFFKSLRGRQSASWEVIR